MLSSIVSASTHAAVSGAEKTHKSGAPLAVGQALSEALERDGMARIEVTLDLTERPATDLDHSTTGSDVHPAVFDIAMMAAPGTMKLDQVGTLHLMRLGSGLPKANRS